MSRNDHKKLTSFARKMQTKNEKKMRYVFGSPFGSHAWNMRKESIEDRVKKQNREATAKAMVRKYNAKPEYFNTSERKNSLRIAQDIVKKLDELKAKKKPFISKRSLKKHGK